MVKEIKYKEFNLNKAESYINNILDDSNDFKHLDNWNSLDNLTYTNGLYIDNTAIFIDIRNSSIFTKDVDTRVSARLYRAYINELIIVLRSHKCCKEINIVGDCVSAIFVEDKNQSKEYNDKSDIIEALQSASMINATVDLINTLFSKKYPQTFNNIKIGIGISSGEALIFKAGEKGSGINKPIFLGKNVNYASHLCDSANKEGTNYPMILVDSTIFNNSKNFIANEDTGKTFNDYLSLKKNIDNFKCYGGNFYRISIKDRVNELK